MTQDRGDRPLSHPHFDVVQVTPRIAAVEWGRPRFAEIPAFQRAARARVSDAIAAKGLTVSGPELTFSCPPEAGSLAMAPGVIVDATFEPAGAVEPQDIPGGRAAHYRYEGPYEGLADAWGRLHAWMQEQELENAGLGWEIYADPQIPITDLYVLVR